jgi:glycerol uptake facilitator-like aquaporin
MIARISLAAAVLVVVILATSAYLRLSATTEACAQDTACAAAVGAADQSAPARNIARAAHRLSASTVAVLVLLIAALAWLRREGRRETRWVALLLIGLTVFLAALGAIAGSSYSPAATLGNVLAANAMAGAAWWLYLRNRAAALPAARASWLMPAGAGVALVAAALLLAPEILPVAASRPIGVALTQNLAVTFIVLACVWLAWRALSMRR